MIKRYGVKMTANEYAKEVIVDNLYRVLEGYWVEGNLDVEDIDLDINSKTFLENIAPITEKELHEIHKMARKRVAGLIKYLGYDNSHLK